MVMSKCRSIVQRQTHPAGSRQLSVEEVCWYTLVLVAADEVAGGRGGREGADWLWQGGVVAVPVDHRVVQRLAGGHAFQRARVSIVPICSAAGIAVSRPWCSTPPRSGTGRVTGGRYPGNGLRHFTGSIKGNGSFGYLHNAVHIM